MAETTVDARAQQVLELLSKFSLEKLDHSWIKYVIDSDYTEVEDMPSEFEDHHYSTNLSGLFSAVISCCRQWVDTLPPISTENSEKRLSFTNLDVNEDTTLHTRFWIDLSEDVKGLLALLFYYSYRGQRYDAKEADRELGIQAASLYFLLLSIPGSNAFRVFHPVLYLKSLDIMRLTTKLRVGASSPKKGRPSALRGSQRKSHDDHLVADADEDDDAEMAMLTPNEANKLIRSLNILLNDFLRLTQRFSLKHSPESLDETISILIDVSRCETNNAQAIFIGRHGSATVTALTYNAYVALQSVCNVIHGKIKKIVIIIMKHILYNILMVSRGSSDLSTRSLGVIRDHSQIFVKYILTQVKQDAYEGVYILIQHLCIRVPDRAEFRQKTAQSVVEILRYLPIQLYTHLMKWFFKFSHNEKAGHRLFLLEVISKMLREEERHAEGERTPGGQEREVRPHRSRLKSITEEGVEESDAELSFVNVSADHPVEVPPDRNILSHKFLLSIIFSRCRDSAATVRSKALALLADCTFSTNPTIMLAMKQIFFRARPAMFATPHISNNNINLESPIELDGEDKDLELPNAARVVSMLHRRALDDKVTVRKSALQVLENLMRLDNEMLTEKNLEVLAEHCRDPALLVRKQIITSLSTLMNCYPEHETVISTWIMGVIPLILDPEVKVQERVVEVLDQLLFRNLLVHGHPQSGTPENKLPWLILGAIIKRSFHKFFNKALVMWSKSEFVKPKVIKLVRSHIGKENNEEAWTLLALLSTYITVKDATFAVDYFEEHCQVNSEVGSYTLLQVLKVLNNSIKHVPGDRAEALQQQLLEPITSFSVGAELISHMMDTITLLSYSLHGDDVEGQKAIEKWAAPLLKNCDEHLKHILFERAKPLNSVGEEKLFRHLFTLGETSMLCPQKVNKRMFLMLQSIIFHQPGDKFTTTTAPSSQTQSSQPTTITFAPTTRVQALAVVTLGKMCLQHEDQAKRIIPALGKMLDTTKHSAIKINIVFTLSDMCVRYATLVDPLMPQVTACLRDPDIRVRRTTLTLLINLLQEDYLKLKGSFFYRILQCLTDDHEDIRSTVIFYITERLLKRFPKILNQHFIECIFHYNCYEEHESYNKFTQSSMEKELFSLAGKEHTKDRHLIYRFMLDHMPDDQRFSTTQRLCQDVLGGVVDGRIKLTPSSLPMLQDTLTVLSCDEIKLASLKNRPEDVDQPTDQAEQAAMAGMVIKKTIISQVVKRHVIENIVPILIAMKHKLEEHRSPLMKHLLLYLKEIMKDYKNEVKEILTGDKQLAKEIEFDLRRFDQEQQEEEQVNNVGVEEAGQYRAAEQSQVQDGNQDKEISEEKHEVGPLGSSPILPPRILNPDKRGTPSMGSGSKSPSASSNELRKLALLNCKTIAARRRSISVPTFNISAASNNASGVVKQRRCSMSDFREKTSEPVKMKPPEKDKSHVDPRPVGGYPTQGDQMIPEHIPNQKKDKGDLMRAISTPQAEKSVISNITFVNETQEVSAISIDSTISFANKDEDRQPKLLLHLKRPEAYAKESDFSRLRKSTRRNLNSELVKVSNEIIKEKRQSGGLYESYSSEVTDSEDESSIQSKRPSSPARTTPKTQKSESRGKVKRTRDMASLSPDPTKTHPNTQTAKPSQKRSKKKK
ncbi:condensin-2 complex subunit D3-like isoform X2 [Homarus americanus]|uniref:condensin-2 complex subunit D3-like isoform X2 n=1 Tax=Homarus americanus TaxID=6706 RepID=UPI001C43733A|nr:condensin-2 complex subunit D3-like isoform X2 [Homarus americanus]